MTNPTPDDLVDIVLSRRQVYAVDTDSLIRQAANRLTARALFEVLTRLDVESEGFGSSLSKMFSALGGERTSLIGFHTGDGAEEGRAPAQQPEEPTQHYLKLIFRDEQAAYYQFALFPNLEAEYVLGAARKRTGAMQHIRLELSHPAALQTFIESCRSNPHFVRVEQSSADEFLRAPSNAI